MPRVKCSECGTVQEWGILEDVECKECGAELFEPIDKEGEEGESEGGRADE